MAFSEPDNRTHGRHADHPAKIPAKGWRDTMLRMKDQMEANHLSITAAGIAYFAFLAIFPGLAALVSLWPFRRSHDDAKTTRDGAIDYAVRAASGFWLPLSFLSMPATLATSTKPTARSGPWS